MKHIFIFNPCAGKDNNAVMQELKQQMTAYDGKLDYEFYVTKAPHDATAYVRARCEAEPAEEFRFYACGGDGTANEVLHGVMSVSNASMTCYPCGSGNDYVKYYGAERFLNLEALLNAEDQAVDVMKIDDRYSMNVTNFGFDTTVARTIDKVRHKKIIGGKHAYTTGIVNALFTAMKNDATVYVDGEKINNGKFLLCTVANGNYVGGSFKCAPRSKNNDGLLEVCLVHPISRISFVKLLKPYTNGEHLDNPRFAKRIVYRQGKSVHVVAPAGFAFSLDGEIVEKNDFTIEICPGALRFAVPVLPSEKKAEEKKEPATV